MLHSLVRGLSTLQKVKSSVFKRWRGHIWIAYVYVIVSIATVYFQFCKMYSETLLSFL